jgi:photosystem II stability/assembly factor-like uncharacterized protein
MVSTSSLLPPTSTEMPSSATLPPGAPFQPAGTQAWCWQEFLGQGSYLDDVFFLDDRRGWAVGENSILLHTSDGGVTWQRQQSPVMNAYWTRIVFVNAQDGWVIGQDEGWNPVLLHSENGGLEWLRHEIPYTVDSLGADITWANASTGWLQVGTRIWRTDDGGSSWKEQSLPVHYEMTAITSVDPLHAWATAGMSVLRTVDGGQHWTEHGLRFYCDDLIFLDAQNGWAIMRGNDSIARTTDGGVTWEPVSVGSMIEDAGFFDANHGWEVSLDGTCHWTSDGGKSWQERECPPHRSAAAFPDPQVGWAVGGTSDGEWTTIAHTTDGGLSWTFQDSGIELPSQARLAAAHLNSLLARRDAPDEALLLPLFPSPCYTPLITRAMENLGWNGTEFGAPPSDPEELQVSRRDADLDDDGEDEVVLSYDAYHPLFAGVLDWDGHYWRKAWFTSFYAHYGGDVRTDLRDMNGDGQPELWVEALTQPGGGTGVLFQDLDIVIAECQLGGCRPLWTQNLGETYLGCAHYRGTEYSDYRWQGSEYRFAPPNGDSWPDIQLLQYGLEFSQRIPDQQSLTATLTVLLYPVVQKTYTWNGREYIQAIEMQVQPTRTLDVTPLTETLDLDGDGQVERAVYRYVPECGDFGQVLSLYEHAQGEWHLTQVFTATYTGAPTPSLSLRDVDGDRATEVVECSTPFVFDALLSSWMTVEPQCSVHEVEWK